MKYATSEKFDGLMNGNHEGSKSKQNGVTADNDKHSDGGSELSETSDVEQCDEDIDCGSDEEEEKVST